MRKFIVPEVIQTSMMDCGPASLKALLEGHGIHVSYGRLREACQTEVDGTSIDTLEDVANQLGLHAEQVMLPTDHIFLAEAQAMPALIVVTLPNGNTHFVILWRRHGNLVQVMDPGIGRRWMSFARLKQELYLHKTDVEATQWTLWAQSDDFLKPLSRRLKDLALSAAETTHWLTTIRAHDNWIGPASVDASARFVQMLIDSGSLKKGLVAQQLLQQLYDRCCKTARDEQPAVPPDYWSVRPSNTAENLSLSGAVLLRFTKPQASDKATTTDTPQSAAPRQLSAELLAALDEAPSRPGRQLASILLQDGWLAPLLMIGAAIAGAAGVVFEAVLWRALLSINTHLKLVDQRLGATAAFVTLITLFMVLDYFMWRGVFRLGRRLDGQLRATFLHKIPRLADRYFQSRLTTDMAERSHAIQQLRYTTELSTSLIRVFFQLVFTTGALIWICPSSAPWALLACTLSIAIPAMIQPVIKEQDLRLRAHNAALSRFYLDAMQGLLPIRTHGATRVIAHQQEELLTEWGFAGKGLQRTVVAAQAIQAIVGLSLAAWLVWTQWHILGHTGTAILSFYWALQLPSLGEQFAAFARMFPGQRNITLRLLEPLGAPEEPVAELAASNRSLATEETARTGAELTFRSMSTGPEPLAKGPKILFDAITVKAAGHVILSDISLNIPPGQHVAVVGSSGAGKSSLVGLLLGWHRPAQGQLLVDGAALQGPALYQLRRHTAWVDPGVQLWNRSLLHNISYGNSAIDMHKLPELLAAADLQQLLQRIPQGLQTPLGENGSQLSGGEGQRVRFGRALLRDPVRLVILDEPFRGLDRQKRASLLAAARQRWHDATLFCISHDVRETLQFPRVIVIHQGRIVEDDVPAQLAQRPDSYYRQLLNDEAQVWQHGWDAPHWRRWQIQHGHLSETNPSDN